MAKCTACGRFATTTEGVKCSKCVGFYHRACVNIPQEVKVVSAWLCPGCKATTPKKDNTDTPVRAVGADYQETSPSVTSVDLLSEMKLMHQEMRSFRGDFNAMREEMTLLRTTVTSFGGRMDSMDARLIGLEKKYAELQARPGVDELLDTIERLKVELNDRDQDSLHNDIEITGLPEEQGENVDHLVGLIAGKLGVICEKRDFVSVERSGLRRAPSGGGEQAAPRPRPVFVRLARRQLRDAFLQSARTRRSVTTEGLGLGAAPTKFYVNERLTRQNKMLFHKVREESRRLGWRYAWTKGGRIFVRRESGKASFRVRSESDLQKIFGSDTVGLQPEQGVSLEQKK